MLKVSLAPTNAVPVVAQVPWSSVEPQRRNGGLVAQPPPVRPPRPEPVPEAVPEAESQSSHPPHTQLQLHHQRLTQPQPAHRPPQQQPLPFQSPESADDSGSDVGDWHMNGTADSSNGSSSSSGSSGNQRDTSSSSRASNSSSKDHYISNSVPDSFASSSDGYHRPSRPFQTQDNGRWSKPYATTTTTATGPSRPMTYDRRPAALARPPAHNWAAVAHLANRVREATNWLQLAAILDSLQAVQPLPGASLPPPSPTPQQQQWSSPTHHQQQPQQQQQQQQWGSPQQQQWGSPQQQPQHDQRWPSEQQWPASQQQQQQQQQQEGSSPLLDMALISAMLSRLAKLRRFQSSSKYPDSEMLRFAERLAAAAAPLLPRAEPKHLANTLWALAKLAHHPGFEWMEAALSAVAALLPRYDDISLSQTLWALATLDHQPGPFFLQRFYDAAHHRLPHMSPQSVSNIMWAAAVLKAPPPPAFTERFLATTLLGFPAHKVQGLSNCVWACAVLELDPGAGWLQRLLQEADTKLDLLLSQDVANIMWSLAKLKHAPSKEWLDKLLRHSYSMLPSFQPEVRTWARGPYAAALAQGQNLSPADADAIARQLAAYTGLSVPFVKEANLRIDLGRFRKELLRDQRVTLGRFDSRFTGIDPDAAGESPDYDASDSGISGAFVSAFHDYIDHDLNYHSDLDYRPTFGDINKDWDWKHNF
ncbi:MAG: hypothetical protein WDW38_006912 [Sanguina aurantia]